MSSRPRPISGAMDSGDSNYYASSSTPTTPDGSLTFSPILQSMKIRDAIENSTGKQRPKNRSQDSYTRSTPALCGVKTICCIGAGYVGGPTAAVMAFQNPTINVTVVDRDPVRIQQWQTRHLPIFEPGLSEVLRVARDGTLECTFTNEPATVGTLDSISSTSSATSECDSRCGDHNTEMTLPARAPNLFFSTEISRCISEADIILIAVNTPTKIRGMGAGRATDVTALEAVAKDVALYAKPGAVVVEKSTVPCKTAEIIQETLKYHRSDLDFEVLSNPEFLAAGTAVNDLLHPDRVIIGSAPTASGRQAAAALASVYTSWVPTSKIITVNTWSSELSKLVANSMLAQRISSINSISAICEEIGAEVDEVARSIGLDPRIGDKFLKAGLGFGGSCFKKDILSLVYLAESLGLSEVAEYWNQVFLMNESQRSRFVRRVMRCLNGNLAGKKLAILGYAFKKNTNDTRESPALECIKLLLEDAPTQIAIFDPCCNPNIISAEVGRLLGPHVLRENGGPITVYGDPYRACQASHAVIIATECDEFRNTAPRSIAPRKLFRDDTVRPTSSTPLPPMVTVADPRPFHESKVTESEILELQRYFESSLTDRGLLQRYVPEPDCGEGCEECVRLGDEKMAANKRIRSKDNEQLDWSRIVYYLEQPKWVFDGRAVLDVRKLEALGVRVETIGKKGWVRR